MLYRRQFLGGALAAPLVFNNALRAMADTASTAKTRTIQVPIDHAAPAGPGFPLDYLVLDDFAPAKPTVFVVGDGQQFYVREDVLPSFRGLFGPDVNIVGIGGRGSSRVLQEGFGNPSDQSWIAAYKALQYSQWLADIDAIRIDLLGKDGKICIYGVSGGGQLAHTYLAAYGANVRYAYTESAVFPTLEAEIGLQHDQFWHEITPNERKRLWDVLSAHPEKREFYAQLLQRQNFFVDLKVLPQERLKLIEKALIEEALLRTGGNRKKRQRCHQEGQCRLPSRYPQQVDVGSGGMVDPRARIRIRLAVAAQPRLEEKRIPA